MGSNGKLSFSPIQTISLPPEVWYLIQHNIGKAELRVTLCILFNHFEVGAEATPLTFTEIVEQTKMSKSNVLAGLNAAIERGSVFRKNSHNNPAYSPRFSKSEPMTCINHDTVVNHEYVSHEEDTCHGSDFSELEKIFQVLVRFGLAYHVAHNIAFGGRYPLEDLQNQVLYIFHEIRKGEAPKGRAFFGYIVNRIKFNRFAPKDFDKVLAQVEMVATENSLTHDEVFLAHFEGKFTDQIQALDWHDDYIYWLNQEGHIPFLEEYQEVSNEDV